jgi:uncharacterized repeat protein (TIGR03803 family)
MQYSLVQFHRQSRISLALLAAVILSLALLAFPAHAQTYNMLYNFPGGSKGLQPGDFVVTSSGSILGEALYDNCACALLFNYTNGTETVLHRFSEPQGYQAEIPQGLLLSNGGTLYGTTAYGGSRNDACAPSIGCGIAFFYDLATSKYQTIHQFRGSPSDGAEPVGIQVLDSRAGKLYGLTFGGGANYNGTFYEITADGSERVLYSFGNASDGTQPGWGPVSYGGNFYGVTLGGGANVCNNGGCGTVFKVTPTGKETVLYNFTGGSDGQNPYQLVGDSKGNLYGLSRNADNVVVAIFEVSPTGAFSIAYSGSYVSQIGGIVVGTNGNLYASASGGNYSACQPNGCGQILQVIPTGGGNGTVTVLHQFDGTDGSLLNPFQDLVLQNGVLYGTTNYGGTSNDGVIYKLNR